MSDVDVLLLTLEVEAAAARNADLSLRVEELQSLLLSNSCSPNTGKAPQSGSKRTPPWESTAGAAEEKVSTTPAHRETENEPLVSPASRSGPIVHADETTLALVNLDDALFDIAETRSLLYSSDSEGERGDDFLSAHRRDLLGGQTDLVTLTHTFLNEVKTLKEACKVRLSTMNGRVRTVSEELEKSHRLLDEKTTEFELEKAQLRQRVQELEDALGIRP